MAVIVMICFARSGGTLLNRCLGSIRRVVMLSEVNPLWGAGGEYTLWHQAKQWYGIELRASSFQESILELNAKVNEQGRKLIVRDWPFINFIPSTENGWNPPNRLLTLVELEGQCDITPFAFVRDSIDVWLSRRQYDDMQSLAHYRRYVEEIVERGIPIFKYEDFCNNPGEQLEKLCQSIGLDFDDSWRNFASYNAVTGDVKQSRGRQLQTIGQLPRMRVPGKVVDRLNRNADLVEANRLLGYPPEFHARPLEPYLDYFLRHYLKKRVRGFINGASVVFNARTGLPMNGRESEDSR